ncbi:Rieske (2Fe-2S) protein [Komagataeibacter kakiaceti]|uniref:Rieske (2Fe-2S) protein n=1 Tax=Komagataeibacter kakiaceti TaxID=943261 RepID=UPI001F5616DA|nr:Rieske (2Fe-2S) protein [Komagataeibacter kakiaceti]
MTHGAGRAPHGLRHALFGSVKGSGKHMHRWHPVSVLSDIRRGEVAGVRIGGREVVLWREDSAASTSMRGRTAARIAACGSVSGLCAATGWVVCITAGSSAPPRGAG